jgi:deazaflavin-dependent oxidoreductase (nitroreductase family)
VGREQRYLKPGWFVSRVINPLLMRVGMIPTLAVRGRTSGEWRTVPVNVLKLDGQRYLVAPRCDTQWGRNLRATGRGELRWRGRVEPFRAIEIPDNEKPRVIEAYLARWGYQVKGYFKALPNPADHPVFRIERLSGVDSKRS